MQMLSQNWLYLVKRLGMMMKSKSVALYRMLKILVWLIQCFEELVSDKSFIETCNFLRSNTIRFDQQYKEKAARQIHNASQSSNGAKKDIVKKVLEIINEIQFMIHVSQMKNQTQYHYAEERRGFEHSNYVHLCYAS
jgi:hypothetical protein